MWTRKTAANWIQKHQYISIVGDYNRIIMDGDGQDLYEAKTNINVDLNSNELGKLLAFVFNDYIKIIENKHLN